MPVAIPIEVYERLEKKLGKEEAKEILNVLRSSLEEIEQKADARLDSINDKAEHLITQKKFELKDELTKELATKEDIARLEGEIKALRHETKEDIATLGGEIKGLEGEIKTLRQEMQTMKVMLDRKYMIMYLILLFTIIFLNQNALVFIAKLLGLAK